jgi:hypothetical protein
MSRRARPPHAVPLPRGAPGGGVQLAWARDAGGRKVRASRLAPADRHGRAPFTCLGCGEELIPHLGRIRTPHFAHRPGSTCPLTAPETALHLDAKERLLALCEDAFAGRRRVRALARCPGCRRPTPVDLSAMGDSAEAEGAVGPLRADVLVRSGGRPALAIEILVTHAVEPEKEAALGAAGVPAVEVDAREEWERELEDGAVDIACARSLDFGPCPACRARARADREREVGGEAAEIAELEAYRARGLLGAPGSEPAPAGRDVDVPLTDAELGGIRARFRCPDCGGVDLAPGTRLVVHPCRASIGTDPAVGRGKPVAWRGYDGSLVLLRWWVARGQPPAGSGPRGAGKRS